MNKKNVCKTILFALLLTVLLGLCVGASAECGNGEHEGPFTDVTVMNATCTADGLRQTICDSCGAVIATEQIMATGHQLQSRTSTTKMPTCTENGRQQVVNTCSICGYMDSVTNEDIPALGHQWNAGVVTKQPTETEDGIRTYTCLRNSAHTMTEAIPALGGNQEDPEDSDFSVADGIITGYTGESTELVIPSEINGETITGIDEFAFMGNTDLTSVSLPSSVTAIGDYAFSGCSGLAQITLPSGLTSIGNCVFKGCSSLNNLGIPSGVTSIGSSAFKDCASLTEINLPNNLTSIGSHAFEGCTGLTGITLPNSVTSLGTYAFTKCTGLTSATLSTGLTALADGVFNGCKFLGSIDIPAGVTSIGYYAFDGCSRLTGVTIPQGVTSIAYSAFSECRALTSVEIPNTVTDIGIFAFFNCTNLTSTVIPASVTSIGSQAFGGCSGLTITCEPNSAAEAYAIANGIDHAPIETENPVEESPLEDFLFAELTETTCQVMAYTGQDAAVVIPAKDGEGRSVVGIDGWAFCFNESLTAVTIPDSVTSIGEYAFTGCGGLTAVTIPGGVTGIGEGAFSFCGSLTAIGVSSENASFAAQDGILFDKSLKTLLCYPAGRTAGSFAIPSDVTGVGPAAFAGCGTLTAVTIPSGVTSIGAFAFNFCENLASAAMPDSVTSIGANAFLDCHALTGVTIPAGVTSIGEAVFSYCTSLTSVTIPAGVTSLDGSAFFGCGALTQINVQAENASYASVDGIVYDKLLHTIVCYPAGKTASSFEIPAGVTSIGDSALAGSEHLKSVILPSGVTSIGDGAFSHGMLENVTIPETVTSIGESAFAFSSLSSVILPEAVASIGRSAFAFTYLTSITIPAMETAFGEDVFEDCGGLVITCKRGSDAEAYAIENEISYVYMTTESPLEDFTFNALTETTCEVTDYTGTDAEVVIPAKDANGRTVTRIGDYAFYECDILTGVTIPDSVTSIGNYAFSACYSLTSITIPASVTSIEDYAFDGCENLKIYCEADSVAEEYAVANSIPYEILLACDHEWGKPTATLSPTKTEKGSAERFCTICGEKDVMEIPALNDMKTLYLPAGLTTIEEYAFSLLTADAIIVPDSCTTIEENAFMGSCFIYIRVPAGITIPEGAFDGCYGSLVVDYGE